MVGTPSWMSLMGGRPARMSVSCWVALLDVRRPSRLFGSGRVALPDIREWSGDPAKCPGVVGVLPECSKELADVREWLGGPLGCPGVVGRPSRMSESG